MLNSDYESDIHYCDLLEKSLDDLQAENRICVPVDNGTASNWDDSIKKIQDQLSAIIERYGPNSVGLYLGPDVFRRSGDWFASLSLAVSIGSKSIFTDQCLNDSARLQAIEAMMGYATPLLSDVGRSHYVVMLGDDPKKRGWGGLHSGITLASKLAHSQKTKGTKLIVVSPRKNYFSASANTHLFIRPGTEVYFLLGLLSTMVNSQWFDKQYVRDYTTGFEDLKIALEGWKTERCARLCGLEPAELSGIALKFSRAAMSVIHPSPGTFSGPNGDVAAWAWMAIHMVTANALRPGGIFENQGAIDLQPIFTQLHSDTAPKSRIGEHPLMLMQAPATRLLEEITEPGEGQLKALFVVGEPLASLPQPNALKEAYGQLDLLVHVSTVKTETSNHAHWLLPRAHAWEQSDVEVHRNTTLPYYAIGVAEALQPPAESALPLTEIFSRLAPGLKKSTFSGSWGWHLRMFAKTMLRTNITHWTKRLCEFILDDTLVPGVNLFGEVDRSVWRPSENKMFFLPQLYAQLLVQLEEPDESLDFPLLLATDLDGQLTRGLSPSKNTILSVHPSCGFASGKEVELITAHGKIRAVVHHNEDQHPEAIVCSSHHYPEILNVLDAGVHSKSGAVVLNGEPCRIEI